MDYSEPLRPLEGQEFFQRLSQRRSDVRSAMETARKLSIALYNDHDSASSAQNGSLASGNEAVAEQNAPTESKYTSEMQNAGGSFNEGDVACPAVTDSSEHAAVPDALTDIDADTEAEFEELAAAARRDAEQTRQERRAAQCATDRERQVQVRTEGEAAAAQRRKREEKQQSSARELVQSSLNASRAARQRSAFERLQMQLKLALHTRSEAHVELALATELELSGDEAASAEGSTSQRGRQLLEHADNAGFTPLHTLFMPQNDETAQVPAPPGGGSIPPPAPLRKSQKDAARSASRCHDETENVALRFSKLLMRWGADPQAIVRAPSLLKGSTALHLAARRGWASVLEFLLRESEHVDGGGGCAVAIDLPNSDCAGCYTALMYACLPRHCFGEQKCDSDASGKESAAVPSVASNIGVESTPAAVSVLLRYGASRLATDKRGRTALHLAAAAGLTEHVEVILRGRRGTRDEQLSSAQVQEVAHLLAARDHDAQTPYDLARANGHIRIADALMEAFLLG